MPMQLEYPSRVHIPHSRQATWALLVALLAPLLTLLFDVILHYFRRWNYFTLGLPYPSVEIAVCLLCAGVGLLGPILSFNAWYDTSPRINGKNGQPFVITSMALFPVWLLSILFTLAPSLGHDRHAFARELDQMRARRIFAVITRYRDSHGHAFPVSLAQLVAFDPDILNPLNNGQHYYATRDAPQPDFWPDGSNPDELVAWADFHYLGGDLPPAPVDPDHLVVLVSRYIHAPRDYVHVDDFQHAYTYDYEARVIVFASGRVALIPTRNVPTALAASNALRAKLHLPPTSLGPPFSP